MQEENFSRVTKNKKIERQTADHIVFTVVQYIAINGLPLRGYREHTDFMSDNFGWGLYLDTYADFVFKLKPDLLAIAQYLPSNAKYTSHEVNCNSNIGNMVLCPSIYFLARGLGTKAGLHVNVFLFILNLIESLLLVME